MKNAKTKNLLTLAFCMFVTSVYSQTFSSYDYFSKKSQKASITSTKYIINLDSEKLDSNVVSGQLLDSETNSPLTGVSIIEKGTGKSTITNIRGEFVLNTNSKNPVLNIIATGYSTEEISIPDELDEEENNSLTSLSGLFLANFGEESTIQPNIMLSKSWVIERGGIELRIMGFQKSEDTVQLKNGLNLIKPEISKINCRITGDFIPFKKVDKLSVNAEMNFYRQQVNYSDVNQVVQSNNITSFLGKFTMGFRPAEGLHFYATGIYYSVFEGVQYYEDRFGADAIKNFWNFELSGKFYFKDGALKGTFVQLAYNINSNNYKELINTKDPGLFLIRLGFNKELFQ